MIGIVSSRCEDHIERFQNSDMPEFVGQVSSDLVRFLKICALFVSGIFICQVEIRSCEIFLIESSCQSCQTA
jgi:hypothetical protein